MFAGLCNCATVTPVSVTVFRVMRLTENLCSSGVRKQLGIKRERVLADVEVLQPAVRASAMLGLSAARREPSENAFNSRQ